MTLWIGIGIFILIIVIVMRWQVAQKIDWQKNHRQQWNVDLYRERLRANLSPELADEMSQQLLQDEQQLKNQSFIQKSAVHSTYFFYTLLWGLLIVLPLSYYFSLSRYDVVVTGLQDSKDYLHTVENSSATEKNDNRLIAIQNKLRQDPNDGENWYQLGQIYLFNNEFDNALESLSRAAGLLGDKPHILSAAATALYYQAGQRMTEQVKQLVDRVLADDPADTASLSLLASDAFLNADYDLALSLWQQILDSQRVHVERRAIIESMQMAEKLKGTQRP
ncbi:TPR domain-containing protein [Conservatibacter flavescens]|uniref:Cytochrome c-type biogenesis protein H TPR domain-containing protein n=1 Tax=Conservatibacter flavescens TaxID=28161 RepID=A0A2M8S1X8_9PAST|nr:hypothetical protein [Conservatibacter flavescens]PJG85153.1 hypothetical protein CVP05_07820 [Conservatibacter flavescens]